MNRQFGDLRLKLLGLFQLKLFLGDQRLQEYGHRHAHALLQVLALGKDLANGNVLPNGQRADVFRNFDRAAQDHQHLRLFTGLEWSIDKPSDRILNRDLQLGGGLK